jgi:hypothetical protein
MSNNQEADTTEVFRQPVASNLQMQALLGEMRRMLRAELEPIHERLDSKVSVFRGGMLRKRRSWRSLMSHIWTGAGLSMGMGIEKLGWVDLGGIMIYET